VQVRYGVDPFQRTGIHRVANVCGEEFSRFKPLKADRISSARHFQLLQNGEQDLKASARSPKDTELYRNWIHRRIIRASDGFATICVPIPDGLLDFAF
jgi:hypothetical protein